MVELPSQYQQFIHLSRYARWNYEENRREHWNETVARYFDFFTRYLKENCAYNFYVKDDADVVAELESAVLGLDVMPSMRCLMTAGQALIAL